MRRWGKAKRTSNIQHPTSNIERPGQSHPKPQQCGIKAEKVFGAFLLLLPALRYSSLPRFGLVRDYQYGTAKLGSLRMMIGSLSLTG
jgi:hypothetical protein